MKPLSIRNIDWLSGLLEGEGCFTLNKEFNPAIQLTMTDYDIVKKAHSILKCTCKISNFTNEFGDKTKYSIYLFGNKAIGWMFTLYPLMGQRRQEKIKEIISIWKNHNHQIGPKNKITIVDGKKVCTEHGLVEGMNLYHSGKYIRCRGCYYTYKKVG